MMKPFGGTIVCYRLLGIRRIAINVSTVEGHYIQELFCKKNPIRLDATFADTMEIQVEGHEIFINYGKGLYNVYNKLSGELLYRIELDYSTFGRFEGFKVTKTHLIITTTDRKNNSTVVYEYDKEKIKEYAEEGYKIKKSIQVVDVGTPAARKVIDKDVYRRYLKHSKITTSKKKSVKLSAEENINPDFLLYENNTVICRKQGVLHITNSQNTYLYSLPISRFTRGIMFAGNYLWMMGSYSCIYDCEFSETE